jgi:ATP-dependent exoDNAse (exonuclease V) beta subunit
MRNGKALVGQLAAEWDERFDAFRAAHERHITGEAALWLRGFLSAYEARKRRDGVLDFQDLLLLARDMLRRPGIAEDLRRSSASCWSTSSRTRTRCRWRSQRC